MGFCCLAGNRISVHRSPSRSTNQERTPMNIPVRKSTSRGSSLLPELSKCSEALTAARATSWLFREGSAPSVPASGDSVIKLKQVHVIRCCSRAPVLVPLMTSGRAFSCGEVVISGLQLKTIDRFSHHCRRRLGGRKKRKKRNF